MGILTWILFGLVVGVIAKLLMPGRDPGGFIVTILLGVETRNKNLNEASSQNDSLIRQVLAAARSLEVNASDIQTDFIHVDLAYQNNDSTIVDYYKVTKEVQIVLKSVAKFETLVSALLHAGANHIYGIDFSTSELRKYRDQARALDEPRRRSLLSGLPGA